MNKYFLTYCFLLFSLFVWAQVPTITNFTPTSGSVGTSVTIAGTNFDSTPSNNIVFFGATRAAVTSATTTSLTVTVPAGATYQPITVLTNGLVAYSSQPFVVTFTGVPSIDAGSFAAKADFTTGSNPWSVSIGDLDGDGKDDLVLANQGSNTVSVLLNTSSAGAISYAAKVDFTTGSNPWSVSIGDLDGDGKSDLAVANLGSNTVSVLLNTSSAGTINYAAKVDFTTGILPFSVSIGDLDGDGKADLAVANAISSTVSVFRNTGSAGSISYSAKVDFTTGGGPISVAIGDLDGDGKADLAVANSSNNTISVFLNTSSAGTISYAAKVDFTTGTSPQLVSIGDLDGDGKADLAVANASSNTVSVFRNTSSVGTISYAAKVDFTTGSGSNPQSVSIGDLDGDGKADLAVANSGRNTVSVFLNTSSVGTINYAAKVDFTTGAYPTSVSIGDLDGDGKADLAVANLYSASVSVFRNTTSTAAPMITSFTPTSVGVGTSLIITGTNFSGATAVSFGGTAATSFSVVSASSITAAVGTGTSGNVSVTTPLGTAALAGFTFVPTPSITSFTPTSGPVGTSVTITGTNFDVTPAHNIVFFGATQAIVTSAATTSLTVTVPVGATYQPITVLTNGLVAYSGKPFEVTFTGVPGIDAGSFAAKTNFTTGSNPWSVSIGDLDGDGKADLAVANQGSNTVSVFRNTSSAGTISYAAKVDFAPGSYPQSVSIGDLDGDGKADLAVANQGENTVSVFRNTSSAGTISYAAKVDFTTGTNPISVSIGDFDGDGKADLAVANYQDNTVSVFQNTGTVGSINYAVKVDFTTGTTPLSVAIGDLDGDGKADLAVANSSNNTISVFLNTSSVGTISYAAKLDFTTGGDPISVAIGDLDGDGKADIAVANFISSVSVFRNTSSVGTISYAAKVDLATGLFSRSVSIGDLDGDGKADLAVANASSNTVSVFRNTSSVGSINYAASVDFTTGTNPTSVSIGDLDGDGKADLAVANGNSSTVSVLRNTASTTVPTVTSFTPTSGGAGTTITLTGTNFSGATAVSFGGTAAISFSVVSATSLAATVGTGISGNVSVTTPLGTAALGGFTLVPTPSITSFTPTSGPVGTSVTITGTNFDATPSNNIVFFGATQAIVTVATTTSLTVTVPVGATYQPITVLTNSLLAYSSKPFEVTFAGVPGIDGSSFAVKTDFTTGTTPTSVAIGDLDGDGKDDLAVANYNDNTVSVLLNTSSAGTISYAAKVDFTTGGGPFSVSIGDLNGDGKADLAVANPGSNTVSVLLNTGSAGTINYAAKVDFTTGTTPLSVSIGDLDGDGKADLAVANQSSKTVSVFRNTGSVGSIGYAARIDFATGIAPYSVSIGDLDGDGKADLAVANGSNTVSVLLNTSSAGTINYAAKVDFTTGTDPTSVSIGDFDGDGKADLAVANRNSNTVSVFRNTSSLGSISYAAKVDFTTGSQPRSVSISDLDGDGKADLAVVNPGSNTVSVLLNTGSAGTINYAAKVDFTTGFIPLSVSIGDLDGDGKADLAVANYNSSTVSVFRNTVPTATPIVTSFTPTSGGVGTSVIITGTNFSGATAVSFGGTAATSFSVVSATSIAATVGTGTSGNVSVTTPLGTAALAGFTFVPTPSITSFTPTSGIVGATVTIIGTNFDATPANNTVKFNGTATTVTASTATSLTTSVPTGATTGTITVTVNGQTATSANSYTVIQPPTIGSFSPTSGIVGATVTITGTNFDATPANNTVKFNGTAATVTASTATSLTTSVPTGATTGTITVTVNGQTATSANSYTVIQPPTIGSFSPTSGIVGATVTITGTNFDATPANNTVKFNGTAATVTASTATSLTTSVPTGATIGMITVTVNGQTATSASSYTVIQPPTIGNFSPTSGIVGATVTITGTNFDATPANNTVKFNGTAATVTASTATSLTTSVPTGATIGMITVTVNGQTATSSNSFIVIPPPTIGNFSPTSGIVGATVTITGTNFNVTPANNTVKFNGTAATVTASTATSLTTSVPTGATTGMITVTVNGQTATSANSYTLLQLQAINFGAIPAKTFGTDVTVALTATATSDLTITYSSTNTDKVIISGSTATIIKAGAVTINADQAGNTNYTAATRVSQTFCINPSKPSIALTGIGTESLTLTSSNSTGNQWFLNGIAIATGTAATLTVSGTTGAGSYTVKTTVDNCASTVSDAKVIVVTGDLAKAETKMTMFPNPAKDKITLTLNGFEIGKAVEIGMFDLTGRSLNKLTGIGGSDITIDVSGYATGKYLLQAVQGKKIEQRQFVKE